MTARLGGSIQGRIETMNHPSRSKSIEARIRRLIERRAVARIEIVTRDGVNFTAIAYPANWHPIVAERRKLGFASAVARLGREDLTIAEAQEVTDKAISESLARASANSIDEAISGLERELAEEPS